MQCYPAPSVAEVTVMSRGPVTVQVMLYTMSCAVCTCSDHCTTTTLDNVSPYCNQVVDRG